MSQFYSESGPKAATMSETLSGLQLLQASQNGYSEIYKAQYCGKWLVFKRLTEQAQEDNRYQQLLRKEFNISFTLSSPNIVQTFDMKEVEPLGTCIISEFIDGVTWDQYFASPEIKPEDTLRIVNELIEALIYLHQRQIVHRDIKPENILITHDGHHPKLIDFGLADSPLYSILKEPAGTEGYIAPEQLENAGFDCRCDIYSLGCLLEQLSCLPSYYNNVVRRCLASVEHRYQTITQVKEALQSIDRHRRRAKMWLIGSMIVMLQVALSASAWWLGRNNQAAAALTQNNDNGVNLAKQISQQYDEETRDSIAVALERFMQQEDWIRSTINRSLAERDTFIAEFPISRIKNLPRSEYLMDNPRGFTHRLKYGMDWIGAFFDVDSEPYECRNCSDSLYQQQLDNIVKLLNDGAIGDKKAIHDNPLYLPLKYRLLTIYYPNSTYMPFWMDREVDHFLSVLLPDSAVRRQLTPANCLDPREILYNYKSVHPIMSQWNNIMFMDFLFMYFPKSSALYEKSPLGQKKKTELNGNSLSEGKTPN